MLPYIIPALFLILALIILIMPRKPKPNRARAIAYANSMLFDARANLALKTQLCAIRRYAPSTLPTLPTQF